MKYSVAKVSNKATQSKANMSDCKIKTDNYVAKEES